MKPCERTARLGPQGQTMNLTPKEVAFRGAPIPPAGTREILSTPQRGEFKSLALWTGIFT